MLRDDHANAKLRSSSGRYTKQLASRRRVRTCIDDAERRFRECWQTLIAIKGLTKLDGNAIFAFQPCLASALFELDAAYLDLINAQKALIQRKTSLSVTGFVDRMRSLAEDLKGLRKAIDVGRSLGDAFAWVFYKHDQPLLERHFKEPRTPHTPPGIGGRGELEFIRQARPAGFFTLYHGITTFLRIGDVSFYDLETRRISSLAELKSIPIEPGRVSVRVHMIGEIGKKMPFLDPSASISIKENPPGGHVGKAKFEKRLKKQMKRLAEAARPEAITGKSNLLDAYHVDELSKFGQELSAEGVAYQGIGKGLVLAGISAFRGKSLSSRIFSKASEKSVIKRMRKITARAIDICDPALPDNSMLFSELDIAVRIGSPPLFWFPCDGKFLEALYFVRTAVCALYNPAHLFKNLREQGYEVMAKPTKNGPPTFEVTKRMSGGIARIEHFDFFLWLIEQRFMREERILEMLDNSLRQLPPLNDGEAARIQLSFVHMF
jgi:hypothetical protein